MAEGQNLPGLPREYPPGTDLRPLVVTPLVLLSSPPPPLPPSSIPTCRACGVLALAVFANFPARSALFTHASPISPLRPLSRSPTEFTFDGYSDEKNRGRGWGGRRRRREKPVLRPPSNA